MKEVTKVQKFAIIFTSANNLYYLTSLLSTDANTTIVITPLATRESVALMDVFAANTVIGKIDAVHNDSIEEEQHFITEIVREEDVPFAEEIALEWDIDEE